MPEDLGGDQGARGHGGLGETGGRDAVAVPRKAVAVPREIGGPLACGLLACGPLCRRNAPATGQRRVSAGQRVAACGENAVHPQAFDQLLAGQGVGHVTPEHLFEDAEGALDLGEVEAGHETMRRDLLGRDDDRLDMALVDTLHDEAEQRPEVAAALLGA